MMAKTDLSINIVENELDPIDPSTPRRIDWRSPAGMVTTFCVGLIAAIGQHVFYSSLAGDLVGSMDRQQQLLRYVKDSPFTLL